jgi:hypothetical protein
MLLSDLAAVGSFHQWRSRSRIFGVPLLSNTQVNRQVLQAERNQQAAIRQAHATRTVELILNTTDAARTAAKR